MSECGTVYSTETRTALKRWRGACAVRRAGGPDQQAGKRARASGQGPKPRAWTRHDAWACAAGWRQGRVAPRTRHIQRSADPEERRAPAAGAAALWAVSVQFCSTDTVEPARTTLRAPCLRVDCALICGAWVAVPPTATANRVPPRPTATRAPRQRPDTDRPDVQWLWGALIRIRL